MFDFQRVTNHVDSRRGSRKDSTKSSRKNSRNEAKEPEMRHTAAKSQPKSKTSPYEIREQDVRNRTTETRGPLNDRREKSSKREKKRISRCLSAFKKKLFLIASNQRKCMDNPKLQETQIAHSQVWGLLQLVYI